MKNKNKIVQICHKMQNHVLMQIENVLEIAMIFGLLKRWQMSQ